MSSKLLDVFSKSRAEEYPSDLWDSFVIPPRYREYSCLFNYTKAVMIEGGRGSGKTMFVKYHCHQTRFSKKRSKIYAEELSHVGLYFRPDTDFCSMINSFNFDDAWRKTFTHYILINVLRDFALAVKNISETLFEDISFEVDLMSLDTPEALQKSIPGFPRTYGEIDAYQKQLSAEFNFWVNDIDSFEQPKLLEPNTVLKFLIEELKGASKELNDLCFYVYFDEFENLSSDQQVVINSWMKHGQAPLLYNAAYKRGADVNRKTASEESLVQRNDYRIVDVENFEPGEFKMFAAEVLALKLIEEIKFEGHDQLRNYFCNEIFLNDREDPRYKSNILKIAKSFLPSINYKEIAEEIFADESLKNRLEKFLIPVDSLGDYTVSDFVDSDYPEESLINGILLNRKRYDPDKVHSLFERCKEGDSTVYKSLIDQNLVGAILWIYQSASWKNCPVYTGFERFCHLSKGNMRHFLELCHQTLSVAARKEIRVDKENITPIPVEIQAEAASNSSRLDLVKIDELGRHGEKLRFIANRLGLFFQIVQKRKSQSETEINHFSIKLSDNKELDPTVKKLLEEAIVWSVLVKVEGDTKRKDASDASSTEYMLHPIYSPYFGISFRRKKKFDFTKDQVETLFSGDEKSYFDLCSEYANKWDVDFDKRLDAKSKNPPEVSQRGFWDC